MPDGFSMYTYPRKEEPLVKLANVIPPPPKAKDPEPPVEGDENANSVLWSYKKDPEERKKDDAERDTTPSFDFSEKVIVEGKERKIELSASGLYVFDKKEKFDKPKAELPMQYAAPQKRGVWVGVTKPMSDGKVIVPLASKASDFKTVKIRGRNIKGILELTKKR